MDAIPHNYRTGNRQADASTNLCHVWSIGPVDGLHDHHGSGHEDNEITGATGHCATDIVLEAPNGLHETKESRPCSSQLLAAAGRFACQQAEPIVSWG